MAVHSARASLASRIRGVSCSLAVLVCGSVLGEAALLAQPPSPNAGIPTMERWNGNSKVPHLPASPAPSPAKAAPTLSTLVPVKEETRQPPAPPASSPNSLPPLRPVEAMLQPPPPMQPLPPIAPVKPISLPPLPPPLPVKQPAGPEFNLEAVKTAAWLVKESTASLQTCAQWLKAMPTAGEPPAQSTTARTVAEPPSSQPATPAEAQGLTAADLHHLAVSLPWHQVFLMQLPVTLTIALGIPIVLIVGLLVVLRRSGVLLRVELVNSLGQGMGGWLPRLTVGSSYEGASREEPAARAGSVGNGGGAFPGHREGEQEPACEEPFSGEHFELGPTYEEEKKLQAEALLQKELAVLRQVFEENKKLQEEIRQLEGEDTSVEEVPAETKREGEAAAKPEVPAVTSDAAVEPE